MPIVSDAVLYSVVREEHMVHNDFFLHEHFSFFSSRAADRLAVRAKCGERVLKTEIPIIPYESPNRYTFPLRGTVLVTDTYPSINSHRWCRNSEFAFDAGSFKESLEASVIRGAPVFAACGGVVEEVFDGLPDTGGDTDLEQIEKQYGEHVRIDGNHVLSVTRTTSSPSARTC